MLLLIIFSTILILVVSHTECMWTYDAVAGTPFDKLRPCDDLTSERFASTSCTRVCSERIDPLHPG